MASAVTKRDSMGPRNKILQKGKGGMRMVRADGKRSYFELEEPAWEPEKTKTGCMACGSQFSFVNRKHHCRRSGIVICDKCCAKIPLMRMAYVDPVRVCAWWKEQCEYENEFFQKSVPMMQAGAVFALEHGGKRHEGIEVGLSDADASLVFATKAGEPWEVAGSLPVQTVHLTDKDGLVVSTKKTGEVAFFNADKDVVKRWRKAIKKMIKVLHGKPRKSVPKEFAHMSIPMENAA